MPALATFAVRLPRLSRRPNVPRRLSITGASGGVSVVQGLLRSLALSGMVLAIPILGTYYGMPLGEAMICKGGHKVSSTHSGSGVGAAVLWALGVSLSAVRG